MVGFAERGSPAGSCEPDRPLTPQIEAWCRRDLEAIRHAFVRARSESFTTDSLPALHLAAHNLYGASFLYGGEALVMLSGTLQLACRSNAVLDRSPELIRLLIDACRLCTQTRKEAASELGAIEAVCDLVRGHLGEENSRSAPCEDDR